MQLGCELEGLLEMTTKQLSKAWQMTIGGIFRETIFVSIILAGKLYLLIRINLTQYRPNITHRVENVGYLRVELRIVQIGCKHDLHVHSQKTRNHVTTDYALNILIVFLQLEAAARTGVKSQSSVTYPSG